MAVLFDQGIFSIEGLSGEVLPGAKLFFYASGSSTPQATYVDDDLTTPNANPVVAAADGRFPSIWLSPLAYKIVLKSFDDVTLVTRDPINGANTPSGGTITSDSLTNDPSELEAITDKLTYSPETGLPAQSLTTIFRNGPAVSALYFRLPSDPDDTLAIDRALNPSDPTLRLPVYLQGGKGSGPNGEWMISQMDMSGATSLIRRSGVEIFGDGKERTIVRPNRAGGYAFHCAKITGGDITQNYFGVYIHDLAIHGWVLEEGFQEHTHLISLSSVSNVTIERCNISGFRGDGIYIGMNNIIPSDPALRQVINERVTIEACYFDGLNRNNRNAISFITIREAWIENCTFVRCSRPGEPGFTPGDPFDVFDSTKGPGMPGVIDFEPDSGVGEPFIQNILVTGNRFFDCGGNVACIGFHIPDTILAQNVGKIEVSGNFFRGSVVRGSEIYFRHLYLDSSPMTNSGRDYQIDIHNNKGNDAVGSPFNVFSARGVRIQDNDFSNYNTNCHIGYFTEGGYSSLTKDIVIKGNRFTKTAGSGVLSVFGTERLRIQDNEFVDCGTDASSSLILFQRNSTSSGVSITGNRSFWPTRTMCAAVVALPLHTLTPATNQKFGNNWSGADSSSFLAEVPV